MGIAGSNNLFRTPSSGSGISSGAKNYLTTYLSNAGNGDFETGTSTGWALGTATLTSSLPTGAPSFGSGANANLAFSSNGVAPLAGTYSGLYSSSTTTTAGNFLASNAFTIDLEDQSKVMTFRFYYLQSIVNASVNFSGTSSNSFGVAIYDVTNSAWIIPAGVWSMTQSVGVGLATGTFQTTSNSTSYRIVVYNANATANAVTMQFDDFFLGPQTIPIGTPQTDWVAYTPVFVGAGTVASVEFYSRRNGPNLCVRGKFTTGTCTGSTATMTLGFQGVSGNVTIASTTAINNICLVGNGAPATAAGVSHNILATTGATTVNFSFAGATTPLSAQAGSTIWANSTAESYFFEVPIAGWSSNVQMSNDTDTRVCAAIVTGNPASATVGNPIIVPTVSIDTHGAYSASTGRFTCPITGLYKIYGALISASSATTLSIYKNAVLVSLAGNLDSNGEATFSGAVSCVAGDIIDLRPGGTVDATDMAINFERMTGPAVVAATESVNCRYTNTAGTSIANSGDVQVPFATKDYDSHSAFATPTFTVPVSGKYRVSATVNFASSTYVLGDIIQAAIYKNGAAHSRAPATAAGTAAEFQGSPVVATVNCVAGDTIDIRVNNTRTAGATLLATGAGANHLEIERIGN